MARRTEIQKTRLVAVRLVALAIAWLTCVCMAASHAGPLQPGNVAFLTEAEMTSIFGDAQCVARIDCDEALVSGSKCCHCVSVSRWDICCNCDSGTQKCELTGTPGPCGNVERRCGDIMGNPDACGRCSQAGTIEPDGRCDDGLKNAKGDDCPCAGTEPI